MTKLEVIATILSEATGTSFENALETMAAYHKLFPEQSRDWDDTVKNPEADMAELRKDLPGIRQWALEGLARLVKPGH